MRIPRLHPRALGLTVALGLIALAVEPCPAALVLSFQGGGQNPETSNSLVAGKATFLIDTGPGPDNFTIVLQNITSGATPAQGAALTGIVFEFDWSGTKPVLSMVSSSP